MKKILSTALIGILVLSGLGAGFYNNNDSNEIEHVTMQTSYNTVIRMALPMMRTPGDVIVGEGTFNFTSLDQCISDYNSITRERIIEIAEGFLNHVWYPTKDNIFHDTYMGSRVDTPDRDTYTDWPDDHGWKANQPAHSLPYQWGGFSSIAGYNLSNPQDFDEQYTGTGSYEGIIHFAGDIYTDKDYSCSRACGLDCSGFVSRCWNLPVKHATYTLSNVVSSIRFDELQQGDILNIPRYHVILFKEFVDEEKTLIRTIECGGPAPNVNEHAYRVITTGDDDFSVTLEGYPLSRKFGLYRYEFIENAPGTPSLDGPASGNVGIEYTYTCVTTDPEGDMVSYCIDWGDDSEIQWFGPFTSGENLAISHVWEKTGTYLIRVKAKDIHDIESGWSDPLSVSMPKNGNSLEKLRFFRDIVNNGVILMLAFPTEFFEYETNYTFMCPGRGYGIWITPEGIYYNTFCGAVLDKDKFYGIANPIVVLGIKDI